MPFHFSKRWMDREAGPNPLTEALAARKKSGQSFLDLTLSNPTQCGIEFPTDWTRLLDTTEALHYEPNPQGDLKAREAIVEYYAGRGEKIEAQDIFLTAGTSEGYAHIFKLLCDPGDTVLIPAPSYPLLETLAELEGIGLSTYPLAAGAADADGNIPWHLDREALETSLTDKTRALFVVQPNNPTGSILSDEDAEYLLALADTRQIALVIDEVFADFLHGPQRLYKLESKKTLVFTLNGLSKLLGLPQLKLAWIHAQGNPPFKSQAKEHLEWICDAYLSVNTASQAACPELLRRRSEFQKPIQDRLRINLACLRELAHQNPGIQPLWPQGGWCIPLRFENSRDDEALALHLLQSQGVLTHPGYFFDFGEDVLVVSLLPEPETFLEGMRRIVEALRV